MYYIVYLDYANNVHIGGNYYLFSLFLLDDEFFFSQDMTDNMDIVSSTDFGDRPYIIILILGCLDANNDEQLSQFQQKFTYICREAR